MDYRKQHPTIKKGTSKLLIRNSGWEGREGREEKRRERMPETEYMYVLGFEELQSISQEKLKLFTYIQKNNQISNSHLQILRSKDF